MYLAPQNIPRAINVLTLGNKVILYYYCILYCNHPGRYVPLRTLSSQFRDHPEPPESRRRCRLDVGTRQADRQRSWSVPRSRHWRRSAEAGLNLKAIDNGPRMVTMDRDYAKTSGLNSRYLGYRFRRPGTDCF